MIYVIVYRNHHRVTWSKEYNMVFTIIKSDLFTTQSVIVHCISSDCALGAGIAKQIDNRFGTKSKLKPYVIQIMKNFTVNGGFAVRTGNVINLVTKSQYYQKPTYKTMESALVSLKKLCQTYNIKDISMPAIGCGLDKLDLDRVIELIKTVFNDTDIKISMYLK